MVIEINNKLGHCINYNTTRETEMAHAIRAQHLAEKSSILPIIPNSDKDTILTYFWAVTLTRSLTTK